MTATLAKDLEVYLETMCRMKRVPPTGAKGCRCPSVVPIGRKGMPARIPGQRKRTSMEDLACRRVQRCVDEGSQDPYL